MIFVFEGWFAGRKLSIQNIMEKLQLLTSGEKEFANKEDSKFYKTADSLGLSSINWRERNTWNGNRIIFKDYKIVN